MAAAATVSVTRRDWRSAIFRFVASLVGLILLALGGLHGIVAPWLGQIWVSSESPDIHAPLTHLWHDGQFGAFALAAVISLALVIARPRGETLRIQLYAAIVVVFLLAIAPFNPIGAIIFTVIFSLPILAYPELRKLFQFSEGRASSLLLALTAITALLLVPSAWDWLQAQMIMADEHALNSHWAMGLAASLVIVVAQLFASTRRPGWRVAGGVAALTLVYLGAAAMTQAHNPGSWGYLGGAIAIGGAVIWTVALRRAGQES